MTETDEHLRDWSDERVELDTTNPNTLLDNLRAEAAATPKGVTKPMDAWLNSQDAKDWAKERTHEVRRLYSQIGGYLRWSNYGGAADVYRLLGDNEKAGDLDAMAYAASMSGIRRGIGHKQKGPIRRGL